MAKPNLDIGKFILGNHLNTVAALIFAFTKKDFRVDIGDVRLWIPERRIFTYPDVMVVQGDPIYFENRKDTILAHLSLVCRL